MKSLYKLENPVKNYAWGSPVLIPHFLGRENPGAAPWAELWMGAHPEGPSKTAENNTGLDALIGQDPSYFLGNECFREFGALPFLYKLLAVEKPLSIQVHPSREQALAGWERENRTGIPLKAAHRNYRDPNHKPEILCALRPFRALCGFRELSEIQMLLGCFLQGPLSRIGSGAAGRFGDGPAALRAALEETDPGKALETLIRTLFGLTREVRRELGLYIQEEQESLEKALPKYAAEWRTAACLASLYPDDPGIIAPLYLNLLELAPGQAVYLPAGILHAYLEGFGVELMANSDNVLRGGLTEKHVDTDELVRILRFSHYKPEVTEAPAGDGMFTYPSRCEDFSLSVLQGKTKRQALTGPGPRILLVTQGRALLSIKGEREELILTQGESAFVRALEGTEELSVSGDYTLYIAGSGIDSR